MDTFDFFREYKISPVHEDNLSNVCENCALNENCGEHFYGCPAPVGYNFQKKGGDK